MRFRSGSLLAGYSAGTSPADSMRRNATFDAGDIRRLTLQSMRARCLHAHRDEIDSGQVKGILMRFGLLFVSFLLAAAVQAKEISLFNGKDLTGWRYFGDGSAYGQPNPAKVSDVFQVKEGGIIHSVGKPNGYLRTDQEFTNFHLSLDWRWTDTNPKAHHQSGIHVRMTGADRMYPMNYEIEIARMPDFWTGDIWIMGFDKASFKSEAVTDPGGKDYPPEGAIGFSWKGAHRYKFKDAEKPLGEWNHYDITLDQDHLIVKLNGERVNEARGLEVVPGSFALQSEGGAIDFRNIKLTPIE
jgi:Domain of Unknown Function (DUF1080)